MTSELWSLYVSTIESSQRVRCQRICSELIGSFTPPGDVESAIAKLDSNYAEIFSSLQITVSILQRSSREDVNNNLGGGRWWRVGDVHGADFPNAISQIEQALAERRTYIVSISIAASILLRQFLPRVRKEKKSGTIRMLKPTLHILTTTSCEFPVGSETLRTL